MPEEKTFIEKTQPKNILEIISEDVLKRLLNSYRFPLQTASTVYYPETLPASIENLHWIELKGDPGLNAPFCEAYWQKPNDPNLGDDYCEQTCKKCDKLITLMYYEGDWNGPRLFHCHCCLWDMTYPLSQGGRLVGVLYGGQVIVTEKVKDWGNGLKDVIKEVVWKPDVKVDWDPSYEKETNEIPPKSDQIAVILSKVDSRTDITQDKKKQLRDAVKEQREKRKTSIEDLVERYKKFREFGKALEGVLEDLYAAKAEAARRRHIHWASKDITAGGDRRSEEPEEFWHALDEAVKATLPHIKGYVLYELDEYREAFEPVRTCVYDTQIISPEAAFRDFCKCIFDELHDNGKKKKDLITHDLLDEDIPETKIFRDLFQQGVGDWNKVASGASVIAISLAENDGKITGGLVCVCIKGEQGGFQPRSSSDFYIEAMQDIVDVLSTALTRHIVKERREKELGRLTHELKVPLIAIRGATQFIKRTPRASNFFTFDYPNDIWSWTDLMGRLIDNADQIRHSAESIQIKPTRTYLLTDVIAPTIKQIDILLRERGFSPMKIEYTKKKFQQFPPLWVDCGGFQQVLFNLLSNAIKYAYNDPDSFHVEIEGDEAQLKIWFRDDGRGIEPGMTEAIFEEGFRGREAVQTNVTGQGLGLWVSRRIIEQHGGKIWLSNPKWPTEFTISLPRSLLSRPSTSM